VTRVPYALLLAAIAAILEFIPMIGPLTAAVTILLVAGFSGYEHLLFILIFLGVYRLFQDYVLSPRLLVALIEYRSGWVTNPLPDNVDYPFGYYDSAHAGLYRQAAWAADNLNRGYYLWRANALSTVSLADGTYVPLSPTINAGTAGVQYFFSKFNDRATWDKDVSTLGFFQTYNQFFGFPFDYSVASFQPSDLTQPPMQLPFADGVKPAAQLREGADNGGVGIGLHGETDQLLERRQGLVEAEEMVGQSLLRINVKGRAEALRQRLHIHLLAI